MSNVHPIRGKFSPLSPAVAWGSRSGNTSCTVIVESRNGAGDADRAELVAHLRDLADLFDGEAGRAMFGGSNG